jgi:hypothetical protein
MCAPLPSFFIAHLLTILSQLPFCAMGLVLVPIYVKLFTDRTSLASKIARVDWLGGFLFIGGLTSFLIGISWGGVQYEWNSAQTVAPIVVGIVAVIIAIFWEVYGAREPFLRPSLFKSGSALATYVCALFQGFIVCSLENCVFSSTDIAFHSSSVRFTTFLSISLQSSSNHQYKPA